MSADSNDHHVDVTQEQRRLLFVLSEALEKLFRLRQILKKQQTFITAQHVEPGPATAVGTLIEYLDRHSQTFLESADLISLVLRGGNLNQAQKAGIITALEILITSILQVHEMLLLLPREAAKPQASFLLRDSFGLKQLDASIVLTNFISAYEYRFEDILKQVNLDQEEREDITRGGNVICQAFADKDNPLSWAVLAHEYGHAINDRNALSEKILTEALHRPKHDDNPKIELKMALNASVVAETVADFIAAHVLGPASLMPILFVEMMQPRLKKIERISAGHPPTPLRVQMVSEYLKSLKVSTADFDVVFETYAFDYSRKLSEMDSDDRDTVEAMGKEAENLLSPLCKVISSKVGELNLRRFEERNLETARALAKKLAERLPISSIRKRSDESIFAGLNSLRTGYSTPDQVYEVVSGLDEEPVAASEILTAGWLYKLSTFEYELKKSFGSGNGQIPGIGIYTEYVEKTERLLLKSLELVEVHSALLHVSTVA